MATPTPSLPAGPIEIHLKDVRQLFHSMDPSPFPGRDLDQDAETFILSWAKEIAHHGPLTIRVHLDHCCDNEESLVPQAIHNHFRSMAQMQYFKFRRMLAQGKWSLLIGLAFMAMCLGAAEQLEPLNHRAIFRVLQEGLIIGGWVALWRPLEIFLYDWWPLLGTYRLCQRLTDARIEVRPADPVSGSPQAGG